ncbi:MAG: TauD/TfdA family dioxygenase [Acidimicrobiia bacterium]
MTMTEPVPVRDRSAWTAADVEADRSWCFELDDAGRAELEAALASVRARGLALAQVTAADFPLPSLAGTVAGIGAELRDGRGFAVLRGFPVQDRPLADVELLYWGLCSHLGTGMTQNSDATLIHYVTEGKLRPNQGARGVGFPTESTLHVDLTDCVSLLCVRQAPDDPPSWLASSTRVFNELLERHPETLPVLFEGFEWDRMDEHAPGETPTSGYKVPVFSVADGVVSCRYNRYWMAAAMRRKGEHNTPEQRAALDLFDQIAAQHRFAFRFEPGDIQFANNYTVLHGRAAHQPVTEEDQVRLLMRIWLDLPQARPVIDDAIVRYGIVRHGDLGWTAAELHEGRIASNGRVRARRGDGATL